MERLPEVILNILCLAYWIDLWIWWIKGPKDESLALNVFFIIFGIAGVLVPILLIIHITGTMIH